MRKKNNKPTFNLPPWIHLSKDTSPLRFNYFPEIKIPQLCEHAHFYNILPLPKFFLKTKKLYFLL